MTGWVKVYRELIEKAIWKEATVEGRVILITLLCLANHKPNEWVWEGKKYNVQPGQFVTSLESIAEKAGKGISIQNVRTALNLFKKLEFLTDESTKKGRLITITNWASYQLDKDDLTAPLTDNQQTPNKGVTANKNVKNILPTVEINSPPPTVLPDEKETEFLNWFNAYPRRDAKKKTRVAYWAARQKVSAETLIEGVSRYQVNKPHYADWKMPTTWLTGEHWEDEDYKPGYTASPVATIGMGSQIPANRIVPGHERVGGSGPL